MHASVAHRSGGAVVDFERNVAIGPWFESRPEGDFFLRHDAGLTECGLCRNDKVFRVSKQNIDE